MKLFLAGLFLLSVVGGFLGGVYFAETAPDEAAQFNQAVSDTGVSITKRARQWWDGSPIRKWFGTSHSGAGAGNSLTDAPIQVFFVPGPDPNASAAKEALIGLIAGARQSVVCAFYDFELERVAHALIARHQAGVKVAVVSDSDYESRPGATLCRNAGIPVVFDGRSALMHNKFCVVDGTYVWTGSTNVTQNCMFRNNNNALIITSAELAENYAAEFDEMFLHRQFGARSPKNTAWPTLTVAGIGLESYFAPEDGVEAAVRARLAESKREIAFMAFVFTSVPLAEVMGERLAAGAQVRGVVERRSAGSAHCRHRYLRERGAQIYLDGNPNTMHHKVIIVDARLVMTGSYNFSAGAETRNDENLIMIHNPEIARLFLEDFERVVASSLPAE